MSESLGETQFMRCVNTEVVTFTVKNVISISYEILNIRNNTQNRSVNPKNLDTCSDKTAL